MIQVNELRIGNLFKEKYSGTTIKVIGITEKDVFFTCHFNGKWQAEPIPLTEEWLFKFGFIHLGDGFFIQTPSLLELANIGDKYFHAGLKSISLCDIYYVHQLQNLYFALTNKELTL